MLARDVRVQFKPLTPADKATIASVLAWDLQREVAPSEIQMISIQEDIVWVALTDNRAVPIHKETFRSILRQQRELAAAELQTQPSEFEIDCGSDGFYRVWVNTNLLGGFYRCDRTDKWVVQTRFFGAVRRYKTAQQAQDAITSVYQKS